MLFYLHYGYSLDSWQSSFSFWWHFPVLAKLERGKHRQNNSNVFFWSIIIYRQNVEDDIQQLHSSINSICLSLLIWWQFNNVYIYVYVLLFIHLFSIHTLIRNRKLLKKYVNQTVKCHPEQIRNFNVYEIGKLKKVIELYIGVGLLGRCIKSMNIIFPFDTI